MHTIRSERYFSEMWFDRIFSWPAGNRNAARITESALIMLGRNPAHGSHRWLTSHLTFTRRFIRDPLTGAADLLFLELYPWRSTSVTAPMRGEKSTLSILYSAT